MRIEITVSTPDNNDSDRIAMVNLLDEIASTVDRLTSGGEGTMRLGSATGRYRVTLELVRQV